MKRIYVCSDSVRGIYSAVYDAWLERRESGDAGIGVRGRMETELFSEYAEVEESGQKRKAVEKMICAHMGKRAAKAFYYAALSSDPDRGSAIFQTMVLARKTGRRGQILERLQDPWVRKVFELERAVQKESHCFIEFCRFRELKEGILFARIRPRSEILPLIAPHFADRFPMEDWVIADDTHQTAAVHKKQCPWILVSGVRADRKDVRSFSENEKEIATLWKQFHHTAAIDERSSYSRQRQHLPLWYRENMVEFEQEERFKEEIIVDSDD